MSIHIDEISAKNLGPISSLQWNLARVNLVYGRNESGKTHLVEFLIQSLFKQAIYPGMRRLGATGRITMRGLEDASTSFAPTNKKKLEDYLRGEDATLPDNISRLLVVRAGELSMVNDPQVGIDHSILEEYLSNSTLIRSIRDRIPVSNQKASLEGRTIQGNRQGQVKDFHNNRAELKALNDLLAQVNSDYATGQLAQMQSNLKEHETALEQEKQAKLHLAYTLAQQIQQLDAACARIPDESLQRAASELDEHRLKAATLARLSETLESNRANCAELSWLKAALEEYQKLLSGETSPTQVKAWLLVLAGLLLVAAVALILMKQALPAAGLVLIGAGLGYAHIRQLQKRDSRATQESELTNISAEFERKFGKKLSDIASLRKLHDEQNEANIAANIIAEQVNSLKSELERLDQSLSDQLFALSGQRLPTEAWRDELQSISLRGQQTRNTLVETKMRLAALQVDAANYRSQPAEIPYNEQRSQQLEKKIQELSDNRRREEERLNSLRSKLAAETRSDPSLAWEKLVDALSEKRRKLVQKYQDETAQLLGSIVVNGVLDELFKQEEARILTSLQSSEVTHYLKKMTSHYERVEYDGGLFKVGDPFAEYSFADLSTATQEQVLLALRLGISAHCFQGRSMFLVLDDAFQHSDWLRRESLVNSIMEAAHAGWQILYLTMDDNIRDLFTTRAQAEFPADHKIFKL